MKVQEQGVLKEVRGKNVWFSRLIAAGLGSSAEYPAEVLEQSGPEAFPVGTHIHADHQTPEEWDSQPANSVKTIAGVITSEPVFLRSGEVTTIGGKTHNIDVDGLYARTEFTKEWAPFVEQMHEFVGLSIHAFVQTEDEVREDGLPVVKTFVNSPLNTVDLVTVPGADGRIISVLESGKISKEDRDAISISEKKITREDEGMKPEDIEAIVEALKESLMPMIVEALLPEKEEEEAEESLSPSEVAEALIEAGLPKVARDKVYGAVKNGVDLKEAISTEKQYIKSISESVEPSGDYHGSDQKDADFTVSGWRNK